jgi:hypothetical protein
MARFSSIAANTVAAAFVLGLSAAPGLAQPAPRTPDGKPDLQGFWSNNTATPLERPAELGNRATFTEEEARAYEQRYQLDRTIAISRDKDFELDAAGDLDTYEPGRVLPGGRASLIIDPPDGKVPPLTAEAQQRLRERTDHLNAHYAENPEDLPNAERCLIVGNAALPPLMPAFYDNTLQIVQTRDAVMLLSEMIHDVRVISLNRKDHLPAHMQFWKGDSIGRWAGDTLVVDTTNFSARTTFRGSSPALRVVERFSLGGPGVLTYRFTIDDPAFTRAWTGESAMERTAEPMFEYACHEANYSMTNVLRGRRFAERTSGERR